MTKAASHDRQLPPYEELHIVLFQRVRLPPPPQQQPQPPLLPQPRLLQTSPAPKMPDAQGPRRGGERRSPRPAGRGGRRRSPWQRQGSGARRRCAGSIAAGGRTPAGGHAPPAGPPPRTTTTLLCLDFLALLLLLFLLGRLSAYLPRLSSARPVVALVAAPVHRGETGQRRLVERPGPPHQRATAIVPRPMHRRQRAMRRRTATTDVLTAACDRRSPQRHARSVSGA